MSSLPPTVPAPPPADRPRPRRSFSRIGCLPALLLALLIVLAFQGLLNPWAFHMGGRFTPLSWSGVGVLQCSNGARDVILVRLDLAPRGQVSYSKYSRGPSTFRGEALVGTPQATVQKFRLTGSLHNAWLDADGAPLTIGMRSQDRKPEEVINLHGAFRGTRLVLEDHGETGHLFRPDGSLDPVGGQFFSTADKPRLQIALDYGGRAQFDALHRKLVAASRSAARP